MRSATIESSQDRSRGPQRDMVRSNFLRRQRITAERISAGSDVVRLHFAPGQDAPELAPREEEVLALVSKGYINKEIARMLGLSVETVRSYLKNIYKKLHVRSRTEAAMKYYGTHPERTEQTKQ